MNKDKRGYGMRMKKTKTTLLVGALMAASIIGIVLMSGCIDEKTVETPKQVATETPKQVTTQVKEEYRIVTDMRGKEVKLPQTIERVVTMDDGLVESVMTILGESNKIVGLGSSCVQKTYKYTYPSVSGENHTCKNGRNTAGYMNPKFADLALVKESGAGINYETIASLEPDVVIIRVCSCCASWGREEGLDRDIGRIDALGIPVVVVYAPPCYDEPGIGTISEEIRVIGQTFNKEERAEEIIEVIESNVEMIKERTKDIPESEKPRVLALGLSPRSRSAGGAGNVRGATIAYYIEKIANAKNAYTIKTYTSDRGTVSAEQVLALNPDVLILPTSSGYHPPSELYTAPYYQNLQELEAVKNRRVWALPWTPCNCDAARLEHPIDLMIIAKASYPERFADIKIHEWVLGYYQDLYGVDEAIAKELRSIQWLDWTVKEGF